MDFDALAAVNATLSQARKAFHEALIVERETELLCLGLASGSSGRKPVQTDHERVRQAAEEYEVTLEAFSKFRAKRLAAAG